MKKHILIPSILLSVFIIINVGCIETIKQENLSNNPDDWQIPEEFNFETTIELALEINTSSYANIPIDVYLDDQSNKKIAKIKTDISGKYTNEHFQLPTYIEKLYFNTPFGSCSSGINNQSVSIDMDILSWQLDSNSGRIEFSKNNKIGYYFFICTGPLIEGYEIIYFFLESEEPIEVFYYKDETMAEVAYDGYGRSSYLHDGEADGIIKNPIENGIGYIASTDQRIIGNTYELSCEDPYAPGDYYIGDESEVETQCYTYQNGEDEYSSIYIQDKLGRELQPLFEITNLNTGQKELDFVYIPNDENGAWIREDESFGKDGFNIDVFFNDGEIIKNINSNNCLVIDDSKISDFEEVVFWPYENTNATFVFEDNWPYKGDYDFNDLVLSFNNKVGINQFGLMGMFHVDFRIENVGANFENGFVIWPCENLEIKNVTGTIRTTDLIKDNPNGTEMGHRNDHIVIFDNASDLVTPYSSEVYNGFVEIKFLPIDFNPYVYTYIFGDSRVPGFALTRREKEVHLPNYSPSQLMNKALIGLGDDNGKFKTENGMPWAFMIPGSFDPPRERQLITDRYPRFKNWAISGGAQDKDWYLD